MAPCAPGWGGRTAGGRQPPRPIMSRRMAQRKGREGRERTAASSRALERLQSHACIPRYGGPAPRTRSLPPRKRGGAGFPLARERHPGARGSRPRRRSLPPRRRGGAGFPLALGSRLRWVPACAGFPLARDRHPGARGSRPRRRACPREGGGALGSRLRGNDTLTRVDHARAGGRHGSEQTCCPPLKRSGSGGWGRRSPPERLASELASAGRTATTRSPRTGQCW